MTSVRRALFLSLVERYLLLVLALASNMVIARLLAPEQIGVYSVSLAVIGVAQALRDFGVGSYLIQSRQLADAQIRTAYGISLVLGATLFVATFALAPWAATYYVEPRMAMTLRISSLNFLLLPFSTVSVALLRRAMEFKKLLYVSIVAAIIGALVSVGLATFGAGENSLAAGSVIVNACTGFGAWFVSPGRRLLKPGFGEWRSMLKFGGQSSLAGFITSLSMDANDLVVGKVLGFQPVAMLSRAQGLMSMFNRDLMGAVRNVALPAFAAGDRAGRSLAAPFARSVALVAVFGWPFYALVSIYALEIVDLLYGAQWHQAVPLVPIFCLAGAFSALNALTPNLLVALGRIDLATRLDLAMQPLRLVMIAVAATVFRTVDACAMAFLLSAILATPVFWWAKRRCVDDDVPLLQRYFRSTGLVTAATMLLPALQATWFGWHRSQPISILEWLPTAAAGVVCGLVTIRVTAHPLAEEALFLRLLDFAARTLRLHRA